MDDIISLIVPVYKVKDYIDRCINSLLSQTYKNIEILLVDDGSPDESGKICDAYAAKDSRIRVFHKDNGGVSSARNVALDAITGKWVIFVDSDDYVHKDMVMFLYQAAIKYSADIVSCCHFQIMDDDLVIGRKIVDDIEVLSTHEGLKRLIEDRDINSYPSCKLYKSELFDGIRFPINISYQEDLATLYLLFDKAKRIVKIPDYLYFYTLHPGSLSFVMSHRCNHDACIAQEERLEYFKKKGYAELHEIAVAKNVHFLYGDISSGFKEKAYNDALDSQNYLRLHKNEYSNNPYISSKDKKLIPVYLKNKNSFLTYYYIKELVKPILRTVQKLKTTIGVGAESWDFSLTDSKKRRIILFKSPCFDNLGDFSAVYATLKLLNDICKEKSDIQLFDVPSDKVKRAINSLKKVIHGNDIILFLVNENSDRLYIQETLKTFPNNRIVLLPGTTLYSDINKNTALLNKYRNIIKKCKDLAIIATGKDSYDFYKSSFDASVCLTHDIVSSLNMSYMADSVRSGIVLCLNFSQKSPLKKDDKLEILGLCENFDKVLVTDICVKYSYKDNEWEKALLDKIKRWSCSRIVVTDRPHGLFFSYITCTPCLVIGRNNPEVKEVYNTFKDCEYIKYTDKIEEIPDLLKDLSNVDLQKLEYKPFNEDIRLINKLIND